MADKNDWIQRLPERLDPPSKGIREALEDLIEVCEAPLIEWLDASPEAMVLYVLEPGTLHRLRGKPDPDEQSGPFTSRCDYLAVPIGRDATYSLVVTADEGVNETHTVARKWEFDVGALGRFEVSKPTSARDQATPFARALAKEINKRRLSGE